MADLARLSGIDQPDRVCEQLTESGELVKLDISAQRKPIWHKQTLEEMSQRIEKSLGRMHDREPLRSTVDRSRLVSQLSYCMDAATIDHVLHRMERSKRVRLSEKGVGLSDRGPQLSKAETQLLETLVKDFKAAGFQPPTIKECEAAAVKNKASVASLVSLAAAEGDLVQVSAEFFLHHEVEAQMRETLKRQITASGGLTLSQIRELLSTTRKYAVPICEYLDRVGFTKRDGDLRLLGSTS
jgi:selenocysteine-specific elongation factor